MNLMNYKIVLAVAFIAIFAACSESNKIVDQISDGVTRGAVLRQLNTISNTVAINSATNELEAGEEFSVVLEYQDDEDGDLLQELRVYVGFDDNTDDDADNSKEEVLSQSVPASAFTVGDRGLPQLTYAISAQELQSAVGLSNDQIGFGGDRFTVRFEILLTDGRTFSNGQNSGTITGAYFSSPFLNNVGVVCAPSVPTPGVWQVKTTDTFGDGWNGGVLTVVLNGSTEIVIENLEGPNEQDFDFTVPDGTSTISIKYSPGSFDDEVLFVITSANGNTVSEDGPNPTTNTELLDFCQDNL